MAKKTLSAVVWKEGDWYVAKILGIELASQGKTKKVALKNLQEALSLYLEEDGVEIPFEDIPQHPEIKRIHA